MPKRLYLSSSGQAEADFDHLSAGEMRLIGLAARRLERLAPQSPMRGRIGGIERANWSRSQLAVREASSGLRDLASAGIDMLLIKGVARSAIRGPAARGRIVNDVDIVVRPEAMGDAFDALIGDGWEPAGSGTVSYHRLRLAETIGLNLLRGQFGNLDLHRTPFHPPYAALAEDGAIWLRAAPVTISGVTSDRYSAPVIVREPRFHSPYAASVPITVEMAVAQSAMMMLFQVGLSQRMSVKYAW